MESGCLISADRKQKTKDTLQTVHLSHDHFIHRCKRFRDRFSCLNHESAKPVSSLEDLHIEEGAPYYGRTSTL